MTATRKHRKRTEKEIAEHEKSDDKMFFATRMYLRSSLSVLSSEFCYTDSDQKTRRWSYQMMEIFLNDMRVRCDTILECDRYATDRQNFHINISRRLCWKKTFNEAVSAVS